MLGLDSDAANTSLAVLDRDPSCSAPFSAVPAIFRSFDFRFSFGDGSLSGIKCDICILIYKMGA